MLKEIKQNLLKHKVQVQKSLILYYDVSQYISLVLMQSSPGKGSPGKIRSKGGRQEELGKLHNSRDSPGDLLGKVHHANAETIIDLPVLITNPIEMNTTKLKFSLFSIVSFFFVSETVSGIVVLKSTLLVASDT